MGAGVHVAPGRRLGSRWGGGAAPAPARFRVALAAAVSVARRAVRGAGATGGMFGDWGTMGWIGSIARGSGYSDGSLGSAGAGTGAGIGLPGARGGVPCACSARARSSAIRSWRQTVTEQAQPSR